MGDIRQTRWAARIVAIFSQDDNAFDWTLNELQDRWGPVYKRSVRYRFDETTYYNQAMGSELYKQLFVFRDLMDPATLASSKLISNELEERYLEIAYPHQVERAVNIDPGYVTEAKLVLATTKDRDHRIYLSDGIFAEVTLFFRQGEWQTRPWTYQDYQRAEVQAFLSECRNDLRDAYKRTSRTLDSQNL